MRLTKNYIDYLIKNRKPLMKDNLVFIMDSRYYPENSLDFLESHNLIFEGITEFKTYDIKFNDYIYSIYDYDNAINYVYAKGNLFWMVMYKDTYIKKLNEIESNV